jgi:hypothetical protein
MEKFSRPDLQKGVGLLKAEKVVQRENSVQNVVGVACEAGESIEPGAQAPGTFSLKQN